MDNTEITTENTEIVPKKRGRPKGSGGNKRPDLSFSGNQELKPGDNSRYLRHALENLNMPPIDISDPKQIEERISWYFSHCLDNDMKPTVTGLSNSLGIDRSTLHRWKTGELRGEKSDHRNLIKRAMSAIEELWEDYMLNGKINPVTGIFLGKNHFGYTDKQDVVITPNNPLGDQTSNAELEQRYLESIPEVIAVDVTDAEE